MTAVAIADCGKLLAQMYARWTLDAVVELVHAVSHDITKRPYEYANLDGGVARLLVEFRARTGTAPEFPNLEQRTAIYSSLLGPSDAKPPPNQTSQFHRASSAVREAAIAFSERVHDTGEDSLREAFRAAVSGFREYLKPLCGTPLELGSDLIKVSFGTSAMVLRETTVASAFGMRPPPDDRWPLAGPDGDGAVLLEKISKTLSPATTGTISAEKFLVLQRVAQFGAATINGALADDWEKNIKSLIETAYSWATALRDNRA